MAVRETPCALGSVPYSQVRSETLTCEAEVFSAACMASDTNELVPPTPPSVRSVSIALILPCTKLSTLGSCCTAAAITSGSHRNASSTNRIARPFRRTAVNTASR
eukprot:6909078-Prymnesium_polylepis.1